MKKAQLGPMNKYLFKPLSFWISPLFDWIGFTAHKVTFLRLFLAAFTLVLYSLFFHQGWNVFVPLSFFVIFLLDQTDGNLVRYHNNSDWAGKFMDGATDLLIINFTPFFIGFGVYVESGEISYLVAASLVSLLGMQHSFFTERRKCVTFRMNIEINEKKEKTKIIWTPLSALSIRIVEPLYQFLNPVREFYFSFSLVFLSIFPVKVLFWCLVPFLGFCFALGILRTYLVVFSKLNYHRISSLAAPK